MSRSAQKLGNSRACIALDEMSKVAALDLIVDLVRRIEGNETLDGADLIRAVERAYEPVAIVRGDKRTIPAMHKWADKPTCLHGRLTRCRACAAELCPEGKVTPLTGLIADAQADQDMRKLRNIAEMVAAYTIPTRARRYSAEIGRATLAAATEAVRRGALLSAPKSCAHLIESDAALADFVRPIVAEVIAERFALGRKAKEMIVWRAKHPDFRSDESGESVLVLVSGQGTCAVRLASMTGDDLDRRFAEAIGWMNGKKVKP